MTGPPGTAAGENAGAGDDVLRRTLEEVRDIGVLLFDLEARSLVFLNREAAGMLGTAGIEASYEPLAELLGLGEEGSGPARSGEPRSVKLRERILGYTVYGTEQTRVVFCRDVSEKARSTSIEEALELMSGFGHLFSAVRHEIGNPINSVKTALTVLRTGYDRFSREAVLGYLDRTLAEISRMEEILQTLKSFSMEDPARCRPVSLEEVLARFEETERPEAAGAGVALEVTVEPGIGPVEADPLALRRILRGLLANSRNAIAGRAFSRVRVLAAARGALAEIRVEDNGRGMSAAELKELFLPFAVHHPGRLGMGLVIARKLLAEMNGTIDVESTPGAGTTVVITLQRARTGT